MRIFLLVVVSIAVGCAGSPETGIVASEDGGTTAEPTLHAAAPASESGTVSSSEEDPTADEEPASSTPSPAPPTDSTPSLDEEGSPPDEGTDPVEDLPAPSSDPEPTPDPDQADPESDDAPDDSPSGFIPVTTLPLNIPILTFPTVGETRDHCTAAPPWHAPGEAEAGAACQYGRDCLSGVCIPTSDGNAVCSTFAITTSYCQSTLGAEFVAAVIDDCGDDLIQVCVHNPNPAVAACVDSCAGCGALDTCTRNEHCSDEWCHLNPGDAFGFCATYCVETCPTGTFCRGIDATDAIYLCVP